MEILKEMSNSMLSLKQLIFATTVLIIVDVITGIINAVLNKELSSNKMRVGIVGKFYEMIIITLTILIDSILPIKELHLPIVVCIFYIAQEGLSIIENTGKYISYPQIVKDLFVKLQDLSKNNKGE